MSADIVNRLKAWCETCSCFGLDSIGRDCKAAAAEIEALKQQVEQGKRDAERYLATLVISNEAIRQFRNEDMLTRLIKIRGTQGYCQLVSAFDIGRDVIEAAIAEAPKQEK